MENRGITVNGGRHVLDIDDDAPLLYALRNHLKMNGPKFGCGVSQCGACTVLVDGTPTRSCQTPISDIGDQKVLTLEGLAEDGKPGPIQQAFIDEQAAQCGYCINGMIMTATALLEKNPEPTDVEIKEALKANLCRCGTHTRIVRAIQRAVREGDIG